MNDRQIKFSLFVFITKISSMFMGIAGMWMIKITYGGGYGLHNLHIIFWIIVLVWLIEARQNKIQDEIECLLK